MEHKELDSVTDSKEIKKISTKEAAFFRWADAKIWEIAATFAIAEIENVMFRFNFNDSAISENLGGLFPKNENLDNVLSDEIIGGVGVRYYNLTDDSGRKHQIAEISKSGTMLSNDGFCGELGVIRYARTIEALSDNPKISAIVFRADSGGGERSAGITLGNAVSYATTKKPLVALVQNAHSAMYRTVAGATRIFAETASSFGAIGTIIQLDKNFKESLSDKIIMVSKGSEDKVAILHAMQNGDLTLVQKDLDESGVEFHNYILERRKLKGDKETIAKTLGGSSFDANESVKRGLADELGGINAVNDYLKTRLAK